MTDEQSNKPKKPLKPGMIEIENVHHPGKLYRVQQENTTRCAKPI
jgi:hypothetical protein